ncbi:MAG TPA: 4Fe-4S binding protein, partial [Rhizobiales bacterium]|nr:4Fe-4S binding protein [Hyphomicrobiales bacterium]
MAVTTTSSARRATSEAAPGVTRIDAVAVNAPETRSLYAAREKVCPKRTYGVFRTVKWAVMALTLGLYYLLPWLRWDRGPHLPDQAVLLDFANSRFYFFSLEIWPQEFYFITGLLVLGALALFLATALAGRVWCGYTCPQTVWTDLMIAVERFWQGDRNARMRLDKAPWTLDKVWRKGGTHLSWLLISV